MAPHLAAYSDLRFSDKDRLKLRKPVVEKMRRDRINGCIEQLKTILEKEFHRQDPNTKLEKADILEMTVSFLRQKQLQPALTQRDFNEGYSHCWRESLHFLSVHSKKEGPAQDLQHLHHAQRASRDCSSASPEALQKTPAAQHDLGNRAVWRPW